MGIRGHTRYLKCPGTFLLAKYLKRLHAYRWVFNTLNFVRWHICFIFSICVWVCIVWLLSNSFSTFISIISRGWPPYRPIPSQHKSWPLTWCNFMFIFPSFDLFIFGLAKTLFVFSIHQIQWRIPNHLLAALSLQTRYPGLVPFFLSLVTFTV